MESVDNVSDRANILREMKICRFCLTDNGPLTNIADRAVKDGKNTVPLPVQIMACAAIEVFPSDGMPQLICNNCRKYCHQAYTFKSNCKKADDALKVFLATGQLVKPFMKTIELSEVRNTIEPKQILKTFSSSTTNNQRSSQTQSLNQSVKAKKRMRSDDNAEIITLNIENDESSQEIRSMSAGEESVSFDSQAEDPFESLECDDSAQEFNQSVQIQTDVYPCPKCDRSFPLKQLLDLHIPTHNRKRDFQCDDCGREFLSKYDLTAHLQTHEVVKPYNCAICQKAFSRKQQLDRHEKVHINAEQFECSLCNKCFLTKEAIAAHMDKHKKKRPFTCAVCNKSFVFKQGLERHEATHTTEKPHKCNYCEASFNSAIKLTRHITTHAGLRPYPCKICRRTFLLSHHLTRHMRSHYALATAKNPEGVIGQHKCDICSMSFRRRDSLINHSAIHSMVNLQCVICYTTFDDAKSVKDHITTHLSGLPYPCEKCDYSFESKVQLEEHEMKHAEMEYEEQIEREVELEAKLAQNRSLTEDDDEYEDGEVDISKFTISNDLQDPEIIPQPAKRQRTTGFLKDIGDDDDDEEEEEEIEETVEENYETSDSAKIEQELDEAAEDSADLNEEEEEEEEEEVAQQLKPITRAENMKVYSRKSTSAPVPRAQLQVKAENLPVSNEAEISQPIEELALNSETIQSLPSKQPVNVKVGDKTLRIQKFIITKQEMKQMAKQGLIEMRGGNVVLKNAGQNVLNAKIKTVPRSEIDSMLGSNPTVVTAVSGIKSQLTKTYQRKNAPSTSGGVTASARGPTRLVEEIDSQQISQIDLAGASADINLDFSSDNL